MKLRSLVAWSIALAALVGCSGNDGKIDVKAGSAALTEKGGDALFTIELLETRDQGYGLDGLRVTVTAEGNKAIVVTCTVNDVGKNGKLDKGDTMTCAEPASNVLGPDLAGKNVDVELFAKIDGDEERVGDATWIPTK